MKINGVLVTLKFVTMGTDNTGSQYMSYSGGDIEVTVKPRHDFKKATIQVKGKYTKIRVPVTGSCTTNGAD